MAFIFKRKLKTKTTYRCIVRGRGFRTLIKIFNSRSEAVKWGGQIENNLDRARILNCLICTFQRGCK